MVTPKQCVPAERVRQALGAYITGFDLRDLQEHKVIGALVSHVAGLCPVVAPASINSTAA